MPEFTEIASGQVFQSPFDCLLFGFDAISPPPNSLEWQFTSPASEDCQLVAEYSAGDGLWRALASSWSIGGGRQNGTLHFEPPPDWAATGMWDASTDIGDGTSLYWIRMQRRNNDLANVGAILESVTARNRPFVIARRIEGGVGKAFGLAQVGKLARFRFVPVSQAGLPDFTKAIEITHQIAEPDLVVLP